ncbi:unnamed protein product, partial [Brassica napus]
WIRTVLLDSPRHHRLVSTLGDLSTGSVIRGLPSRRRSTCRGHRLSSLFYCLRRSLPLLAAKSPTCHRFESIRSELHSVVDLLRSSSDTLTSAPPQSLTLHLAVLKAPTHFLIWSHRSHRNDSRFTAASHRL